MKVSISKITVEECARCGEEHQSITARLLANPPEPWTHFATCPKTNQPILVSYVDDAWQSEDHEEDGKP